MSVMRLYRKRLVAVSAVLVAVSAVLVAVSAVLAVLAVVWFQATRPPRSEVVGDSSTRDGYKTVQYEGVRVDIPSSWEPSRARAGDTCPKEVPVPSHTTTQMRRQVTLEALNFAVPIAAAVLFSGVFLADWTRQQNAAFTCLAAAVPVAAWLWHRSKYPAFIGPPEPVEEGADEDGDDDGKWDITTLLLLGLTLAVFVPVAIGFQFILPLSVIVAIALVVNGSTLVGFLGAVVSTLAVAFVLEFGVLHPLRKRWRLPLEEKKRPREDFCPTPRSSTD